MGVVFGIAGFIAFIAFAGAQLVAGFVGIEHGLGVGWACAALFAAFVLRFTLPISVGSFFGAMSVWGWHWAVAAVFAMPGLLFVIPGVLAAILSGIRKTYGNAERWPR